MKKHFFLFKNITKTLVVSSIIFMFCGSKNDGPIIQSRDETKKEPEIDSPIFNSTDPLFPNSITSTSIDFIKTSDPDAFLSIKYIGQARKEMPGNDSDDIFDDKTYVFEASFLNDKKVQIWAHSSFGSVNIAQDYATKLTGPLGKLPCLMRDKLGHVVLQKGNGTNSSEDAGGFIILFSDKVDTRIMNNDLEETVFHESAHVAFDIPYSKSANTWKQLQNKDKGNFITAYAKSFADREDIAESALFAYTMIKYPGRLSPEVEEWVKTNIPNRYNFFKPIFN